MADNLRDATKKVDYISLDSVCLNKHVFYHPKDGIARNNGYDPADWAIRISDVMDVPAADVVARDCYDRVLAENDTIREQLEQIGKKAGDKDACGACPELEKIVDRLAAYEDTGLAPDELEKLVAFKEYFDAMYGQGLQIANWHMNGDLEPFDSFYEEAIAERGGRP